MQRSITIPLLAVAMLGTRATATYAVIIDTFSDGTIFNTSAPPTQFVNQSGLSGVIGTGERNLEWGAAIPGSYPESLDLNNFVPGSMVLTAGPTVDFQHIANVAWEIDSVPGGVYVVQEWRTEFVVPEPTSLVMWGLGVLVLIRRGLRSRPSIKDSWCG